MVLNVIWTQSAAFDFIKIDLWSNNQVADNLWYPEYTMNIFSVMAVTYTLCFNFLLLYISACFVASFIVLIVAIGASPEISLSIDQTYVTTDANFDEDALHNPTRQWRLLQVPEWMY
jgi:hypothetical protein